LSAFQVQAAKDPHQVFLGDLEKIAQHAHSYNVAVKALPGPVAMSKKIAVRCTRGRVVVRYLLH
jgi:hypothetical protein